MHIRRATTTLVLAASMLSTPALPAGSTESAVIETAQPDVVESEPHGIADARSTVAELLGNHGLSDAQIDERLGQLSDEDLLYLADHADQVQEGGSSPPEYIWILLGVFLVVAIVAAVL